MQYSSSTVLHTHFNNVHTAIFLKKQNKTALLFFKKTLFFFFYSFFNIELHTVQMVLFITH